VKLGVKLALAMTALVAAVVVTAIWSMGFYLRREVEQQLAADIDRTGKVLEEVQRSRVERLAEQNRVIADEPRLKAVVNSAEVDVETVTDVARDMREVANSDILILTSPQGAIRANVGAREKQLSIPPRLSATSGYRERQSRLYSCLAPGRRALSGHWTRCDSG
jgi:hypothetical protein